MVWFSGNPVLQTTTNTVLQSMARPAQTHQSTQNSQQNGAKGNEKCEFLKANIVFF
jgi:hypothetical protein